MPDAASALPTPQRQPASDVETDAVATALVFPPGGDRRLFEAETQSSSSPLAAAFLLGLTVPRQHTDRIAQLIINRHGAPAIEGVAGDDGSRAWEWDAGGVFVVLRSFPDGRSDAYCHVERDAESDG